MLATIIATMVPAVCAAVVITLIPPFLLSKMGKALSLMATGLLLTLALTHLLPEALESGAELHLIGLVVWGTIMVLVGLEMFFNSNHQRSTCPVCAAELQVKHASHNGHSLAPINPHYAQSNAANATDATSAASATAASTTDKRSLGSIIALKPLHTHQDNVSIQCSCCAPLHDGCYSSEPCPNCSAEAVAAAHSSQLTCTCGHDHPTSSIASAHIHQHSNSGVGTLHHWGHSHNFTLHSSEIEAITKQADSHKGSISTALAQGGAPILAGSLFHSLCDGIVIASAFMVDFHVGVAITAAILAHELPQQLSNYVLMLSLGMSRLQGYLVNLVALLGSVTGGLIFAQILKQAEQLLPFALAVAAGSFMYVALSDILPRLNRPESKRLMVINYTYLILGAVLAMFLSHHH